MAPPWVCRDLKRKLAVSHAADVRARGTPERIPVESDRRSSFLFGRVIFDEPVSTSSENALANRRLKTPGAGVTLQVVYFALRVRLTACRSRLLGPLHFSISGISAAMLANGTLATHSPRTRDARLDIARGLALFIIFVAHMPMNPLALLTPGRLGFSDSAEIFVFCSGAAAAMAMARVFDLHGWWMGTARVFLRIWQLYWAHIAIFLVVLATNIQFDRWAGGGTRYLDGFNLGNVFGPHAKDAIVGILTLTYVPNYFDILPMYIVLLALVPVLMLVERAGKYAAVALVIALWGLAQGRLMDLPAEPWSNRPWFFNPFSWQLVFFTGFAFVRGWLPMPQYDRRLFLSALGLLVAGVAIAFEPLVHAIAYPKWFVDAISPLRNKTYEGLLRYAHFLALAYVAYVLAGEAGNRLRGRAAEICRIAGQQALAVFLAGLWLSVACGYLLQKAGAGWLWAIVINAGGIAAMVGVAWFAGWMKSNPWRPSSPAMKTTQLGQTAGLAGCKTSAAGVRSSMREVTATNG